MDIERVGWAREGADDDGDAGLADGDERPDAFLRGPLASPRIVDPDEAWLLEYLPDGWPIREPREPTSQGGPPPPDPPSRAVLARREAVLVDLGRALLQLRLFRRWSQQDLERAAGVDQTSISRLERARNGGMTLERLVAILEALHVGQLEFRPPKGPPPTALELMLHGDDWRRAGAAAERRLRRRRAPRTRRNDEGPAGVA